MTNYERQTMDPSVRIRECIAEAPVMLLDISTLHEYSNHPFIVRDDAALDTLTRDIEANGLITPILVRRIVYNNDYEILSGHRRVADFRLLGREEIAARVIDVDDPIAAHIVIYSNMLQRSKILPSEKGRALALRNEYLKSDIRYKTNKDWSSEWTQELMSQEFNESKSMIEHEKEKYGWEFIFLGANIDAAAVGARMGIDRDHSVEFTNDCAGQRANYAAMSDAISYVRTCAKPLSSEWKDKIEKDQKWRKSFFGRK